MKTFFKIERPTILLLSLFTLIALTIGILMGIGLISPGYVKYSTVFGSFIVLGGLTLFFEEILPAFKTKKNLSSAGSVTVIVISIASLILGVIIFMQNVLPLSVKWLAIVLEGVLLVLVARSLVV